MNFAVSFVYKWADEMIGVIERLLAQNERPGKIVRNCLEQAGYEPEDLLTMDVRQELCTYIKFIYKSVVLGPTVRSSPQSRYTDILTELPQVPPQSMRLPKEPKESMAFIEVNLVDQSFKAIPIMFYRRAKDIVKLNLSGNPMLNIPYDFVQSCTSLEYLCLSNMAIRKVSQNIQHFPALRSLDLSQNRIVSLDNACLDRLTQLEELDVYNNRMDRLPDYLAGLARSLKRLNISNNRFRVLPDVACKLRVLEELDVSFNVIRKLPDAIGQLSSLEKLVLVGNHISSFPESILSMSKLRVLDCRRNEISELGVASALQGLCTIDLGRNPIEDLELSLGPRVDTVTLSYTNLSSVSIPRSPSRVHSMLTALTLSHSNLHQLDDKFFSSLTLLKNLNLDHNHLQHLPDSLCELTDLRSFSCSVNGLVSLPDHLHRLDKLERVDLHDNNLPSMPPTIYQCRSIKYISVASNMISRVEPIPAGTTAETMPVLSSLEEIHTCENRYGDNILILIMQLKQLRILNISFNDIEELPRMFFRDALKLEELYIGGNRISSLPTEHLWRLTRLKVLFLNGNRYVTLDDDTCRYLN